MKFTNRQAIEAQNALAQLINVDLPVKACFDIALLSNILDRQVNSFGKVRDKLVKDYQIKLSIGDREGQIKFTTTIEAADDEKTKRAKEKALDEFSVKVNELMMAEGEDITFNKITLPNTLVFKPSSTKALLPFIEVVNV